MNTFFMCDAKGHVRRYNVKRAPSGEMEIMFGVVMIANPDEWLILAAEVALLVATDDVPKEHLCEVIDINDFRKKTMSKP